MSSLNVRITFVPSPDVLGESSPVVTSVGRMPSTKWPDWRPSAKWVSVAALVVLPVE